MWFPIVVLVLLGFYGCKIVAERIPAAELGRELVGVLLQTFLTAGLILIGVACFRVACAPADETNPTFVLGLIVSVLIVCSSPLVAITASEAIIGRLPRNIIQCIEGQRGFAILSLLILSTVIFAVWPVAGSLLERRAARVAEAKSWRHQEEAYARDQLSRSLEVLRKKVQIKQFIADLCAASMEWVDFTGHKSTESIWWTDTLPMVVVFDDLYETEEGDHAVQFSIHNARHAKIRLPLRMEGPGFSRPLKYDIFAEQLAQTRSHDENWTIRKDGNYHVQILYTGLVHSAFSPRKEVMPRVWLKLSNDHEACSVDDLTAEQVLSLHPDQVKTLVFRKTHTQRVGFYRARSGGSSLRYESSALRTITEVCLVSVKSRRTMGLVRIARDPPDTIEVRANTTNIVGAGKTWDAFSKWVEERCFE